MNENSNTAEERNMEITMTKMTSDDYQYLYGQLNTDKIPDHMMEKENLTIGQPVNELKMAKIESSIQGKCVIEHEKVIFIDEDGKIKAVLKN